MCEKNCYNDSIKLLARRDYSKYKLAQKLAQKGHEQDIIDETINKLIDMQYLREDEYKRMRVKGMLLKGYADAHIIKKCSKEFLSIDQDFIAQMRNDQNIHIPDKLNELIQKKLRYKSIPQTFEEKIKLKNKLMYFLSTKGYSFEEINQAIKNYM